jgi:prolyl-tRNA synthetase
MQNGWALQAGTSHFLGQNFAKAFDVYYQTENNTRELVWATSWGVSTRLLGAMLMVHSDDRGVLLPPRVAPYQVVIVPIFSGNSEADANVERKCQEVQDWLETGGVRTKFDDRRNVRHGSKFYEWERKGVPLRLDIGPRDITAQQASVAARMVGKKSTVSLERSLLLESIVSELDKIHDEMFQIASSRLIAKTYRVDSYAEMKEMLEKDEQRGLYLVPWKEDAENEEKIKLECKATIRCYPFESNRSEQEINKLKCFYSGQPATHYAIFARAF